MPTLDRPRIENRTPQDLVREVQSGLIRIPTFQRAYKWETKDVLALFDSIFRGFPIGNILLWRRPAQEQRLTVGPLVVDAPKTESALWVVDGQQRITSLVGALVASETSPDPRFRVHLDLDSGQFHVSGIRQQPSRTWIPVSRLLDTQTYLRWVRDNQTWLTESHLTLADTAGKAIREYQIPTYVVTSIDEDPLVEIFTRMNVQGKRLTKDEVFTALHASGSAGSVGTLDQLGKVTAELGFGALDNRLVLRSILAYRGGDIFRDDFHEEFLSADDRDATFTGVAGALFEVVRFLQTEAHVPHIRLLPFSHFVPVLVRFVRIFGPPQGRSATLLRRWLWRGAVTGMRAGGTSVVSVRQQVTAVAGDNPIHAAIGLLKLTRPPGDLRIEMDKVQFNHATTKINVLCMLATEPRELPSGSPLDIGRLLDSDSRSPLVPIFDDGEIAGNAKLANRLVGKHSQKTRQLLESAVADVQESHLVDAAAHRALSSGDVDEFISRRTDALAVLIERHIDQMAEWGARDNQSVRDMMRRAI
jgi:hypothetical protein